MSRLAYGSTVEFVDTSRPFSSFDYSEKRFVRSHPIRRLFSLGRSRGANIVIVEDVPSEGAVSDENLEITNLFSDYQTGNVVRVSFWNNNSATRERDIIKLENQDCIGYAVLKQDIVPSKSVDRWHVFEAVFNSHTLMHNYTPASSLFNIRVGKKIFEIRGCLYAQQNQLNKACAQVALRSLCSTYLSDPDLTYSKINSLASNGDDSFNPSNGLTSVQISEVLTGLDIPYFDFNYSAVPEMQVKLPYQKLAYSGIESGSGALIAFSLSGPQAPSVGHIIPFFGHTFNEDSWAPHAEGSYFKIGDHIQYIPSRAWMSSFIAHDDNFGANLCIPQSFLPKDSVSYVVELLPKGYCYSGVFAEIVAANYFYSILPAIQENIEDNPWITRLTDYVNQKRLILRHVPIKVSEYIEFLAEATDWENNTENRASIEDLSQLQPENLWMVEVSVPEVFSTNKRKLGEILLDAEHTISEEMDGTSFVMARFPETYVFFDKMIDGQPGFITSPSDFKSHVPLLTR